MIVSIAVNLLHSLLLLPGPLVGLSGFHRATGEYYDFSVGFGISPMHIALLSAVQPTSCDEILINFLVATNVTGRKLLFCLSVVSDKLFVLLITINH